MILKFWSGLGGAHLTTQQSEELRSWSPDHVDRVRSQLRGHVFSSRMLRRPIMCGCPKCLRVDLEMSHSDPAEVLVMRGDWELQDTVLCLRHRHPLLPLWSEQSVRKRFDFQTQLTAILEQLNNCAF